jgi:hypothetical protein
MAIHEDDVQEVEESLALIRKVIAFPATIATGYGGYLIGPVAYSHLERELTKIEKIVKGEAWRE